MRFVNFIIICLLIFASFKVKSQDNIGNLNEGFEVRLSGGMNMFGPLNVSVSENSYIRTDIIYNRLIIKESKQTPGLGINLLGTFTPYNKRLNNAEFIRYNLMQPGLLGAVPSLYITAAPASKLKLFASINGGIQYYPLLKSDPADSSKLDGFEQRLFAFGGGLYYDKLIRTSIYYNRRWHDFASRTEEYYKANVSSNTYFSNLQFNFTLEPYQGVEIFLNWYGRPAPDPRTKFYNVGLSFNPFTFFTKKEGKIGNESKKK